MEFVENYPLFLLIAMLALYYLISLFIKLEAEDYKKLKQFKQWEKLKKAKKHEPAR